MLSRRVILGAGAVVAAGLVTGAVAFAQGGGPGFRHGMMKRMATAMIDEALEPAQVTPEQRATIYASRDRAFAAVEAQHQTRGTHMAEALALFEADVVDAGRLAAFRAQREAEHRQVADAITQALTEVHDVLTPVQRRAVADWIRAHRPGHGG
ncbi:MAG TPA: periplasmic heavy metal sensor [Candidatus Binatia bacterium]|nr:periplasmic heavy metal sensor [Candidatus Binatia bacterium]